MNILAASNLYPDSGISKLIDKSLISVEFNVFQMHGLLQQMGREIGKRTRLWRYNDALEVLTENMV